MSNNFNFDEDLLKSKILIVDDDIVLPSLIKESELMSSYHITSIHDGMQVLDVIKEDKPDLFLLDYDMPKITGIEICEKLKTFDEYKDIPVIFLTGMTDIKNTIEAFKVGAVDYIIKPVVMEELALRVKTQVGFYKAKKKIEEFAFHMEKLAEERAKQLMHADRLITLGTLSAGLAHEINNPATFISGNTQTMEKFWDVLKDIIPEAIKNNADKKDKLSFIQEEMPSLLLGIKDGVTRIRKVVSSLKAFSRKDNQENKPFVISERIDTALMLCQKMIKENVIIEKNILEEEVLVLGDAQQIEQVLINLLVNANDAMEIKKDAHIWITVEKDKDKNNVNIYVKDDGPKISDSQFSKIWDPFFTTKPAGKGTGLGLPLCRSMIERHQGELKAERCDGNGLQFKISLPIYQGEL